MITEIVVIGEKKIKILYEADPREIEKEKHINMLEEILHFYATPRNWVAGDYDSFPAISLDRGERARKALKWDID